MIRIHPAPRFSTVVLVAATVACSNDRTPLSPAPETIPPLGTVQAAGAPNAPVISGRIVFSAPSEGGGLDIFSMNPDGTDPRQLTTGPEHDITPDVSPDGRQILFTRVSISGVEEVFVMAADGSRLRKLISFGPGGRALDPAWSPDGKQFAISGRPAADGEADIFVASASGRNLRRLTDRPNDLLDDDGPAWSPDGRLIAFARRGVSKHIMVMNADGTGQQLFAACSVSWCQAPSWSPDGTRIAYEALTALGGTLEVKAFGQLPQQIATNLRGPFGGPAWAPDGTKLVYPGIATVDGLPRAMLIAISADGSNAQPLAPAGTAGQYPVWAR